MSTPDTSDQTLREALDASISAAEPPPLRSTDDLIADGRRRLRHRRLLAAAGAVAATVVVAGGGWAIAAATGDPDRTDNASVASASSASEPSPTASTAQTEDSTDDAMLQELISNDYPAMLDPRTGDVVLKEGWRITRQVPEPVGYTAPEKSLGVIVTNGTRTRWMLLNLTYSQDASGADIPDSQSPGASADWAKETSYASYDDWLASMVELEDPSRGPTPLVVENAAGELVAGPAATLVRTRPAPVIDGYTRAGDRMAKVTRDGMTWFVVVRGTGSTFEPIPVDAATLSAPTFDAFVFYLTTKVASGAGVR